MSSDFPEGTDPLQPTQNSEKPNPFRDFEITRPSEASPNSDAVGTKPDPPMASFAEADDGLSYLHPTSLVFELLAKVKNFLVPAAIGLFGAAKGDIAYIIISAVLFIPAVLRSVFRYFTLRYCIKDDHLIVTQGLIFRNVRTVPVERIQNIDFVQNPLHRIFNVAEVKIETASGTKPEATLRVLSMAQMDTLRQAVFKTQKSATSPATEQLNEELGDKTQNDPTLGHETGTPPFASSQSTDGNTLLKIPLSWLIRAGLASNRGMVMIGVATGLYFQFGGDRRNFDFGWMRDMLPEGASVAAMSLTFLAASIALLFLLRLLGVGWFILRFFGYKLVQHGEDLRVSCGLFTKVSATIPRKRVQFISIHRNLIMKWMGFSSIRIETAGGAGNKDQSATESVSKRWFIPIIPDSQVPKILNILRPNLDWNESKLEFQPVAARTGTRLCRLAVIQSIILGVIGFGITRPWGFLAGVIALPLLIIWALKQSKAMRYARTDNSIIYRSGVFTRKTSMTFFEKVQALSLDQNPFDRRWKMTTLLVDTAAAGQAEHRINVRYLDEDFALKEIDVLRTKTSHEQPVFG